MEIQKSHLAQAFSSQLQEITIDNMNYEGSIPSWLNGSFINNGPAQFEVGNTTFTHWFDGFAMLKKFDFNKEKICFQNQFLHSEQYLKSNVLQALNQNEFGTYTDGTWLKSILNKLISGKKNSSYDNCNVNTTKIGHHYIAMTESNEIIQFDPKTLESKGSFHFSDNITAQSSLAHPHLDVNTGEIINIFLQIGKICQYHICKLIPGSLKREIIKTIECKDVFYMHSFSITKNYIILFKTPLCLNKWKIIFEATISRSFYWKNNLSSYFVIINRYTGQVHEIETEPFVCLHSINSFERNNQIIIDLACYHKGNPYDYFYLENLKSEHTQLMKAQVKRYILNLTRKSCQVETINNNVIEFPRINYKSKNGSDYKYAYMGFMTNTNALFLNAIQKLDIDSGNTITWQHSDYYPGEPVFVPNPNNMLEDEGVVMFIAYNINKNHSALIVLDAQTMQQMTKAILPIHLPMGLHSNFY
ncbi:MAG: carotenoid oxygenase family protein [Proteobacteria bacterium]|nr:carotenoid oxygenase family protein [Pseudomonadota bacterium]